MNKQKVCVLIDGSIRAGSVVSDVVIDGLVKIKIKSDILNVKSANLIKCDNPKIIKLIDGACISDRRL